MSAASHARVFISCGQSRDLTKFKLLTELPLG